MQSFMTKIMSKFSNKVLAIFSSALALVSLLVGIFSISKDAKLGCADFVNGIIATVLFLVLAYFLWKDNKKKSLILSILLVAGFVVSAFGNAILNFVTASDIGETGELGSLVASFVFEGIALIGAFAATTLVVIMLLKENVNKDKLNLIVELIYFVSAIFFVLGGILALCNDFTEGLAKTTSFFDGLLHAGEVVFFAAAFYNLLKE